MQYQPLSGPILESEFSKSGERFSQNPAAKLRFVHSPCQLASVQTKTLPVSRAASCERRVRQQLQVGTTVREVRTVPTAALNAVCAKAATKRTKAVLYCIVYESGIP